MRISDWSSDVCSSDLAQMDSVVGTDRGFRVNLGDFPLETQPFARALNDLLARLDEVAEQRETFAANVAHELRTPLAILMIELDRLGSPDALRLKKDVEIGRAHV